MASCLSVPLSACLQKLEGVVSQLRVTEEGLGAALARAEHAQDRYEKLHADFSSLQAELEQGRGEEGGGASESESESESVLASAGSVSEAEAEALVEEFRGAQTAEFEKLRAEIASLQQEQASQQPRSDGDAELSSVSSSAEEQVGRLGREVDLLQEEAVDMVRGFEALEEAVSGLQGAGLDQADLLLRAVGSMEVELTEDIAEWARGLPEGGPSLELLREEAAGLVREAAEAVERSFSGRVEALREEFYASYQEQGQEQEQGQRGSQAAEEELERVVARALAEELQRHKDQTRQALEAALHTAQECPLPPSPPSSSSGAGGLAARDFALRGAGARVLHSLTSATYSPTEAEQLRRSQYSSSSSAELGSGSGSGSGRPSLRSTVSGLLTGALDRAEGLLGSDVQLARRGVFETGVGGPDEALSQDVSLGSCWAMQVRRRSVLHCTALHSSCCQQCCA
jgi:hypothetical protein